MDKGKFKMKNLTVFQKHQLNIAKKTLKMSDIGASIIGGMTKEQARNILWNLGYSKEQIKKIEE